MWTFPTVMRIVGKAEPGVPDEEALSASLVTPATSYAKVKSDELSNSVKKRSFQLVLKNSLMSTLVRRLNGSLVVECINLSPV